MCLGNVSERFDRLAKNGLSVVPDDDFQFECSYSLTDDIVCHGNFSVLHLNVRSLCKNLESLVDLLDNLRKSMVSVDIILLCETWLHDGNSMLVDIPGYNLFLQNRENNRGGGLAIFTKKKFGCGREL